MTTWQSIISIAASFFSLTYFIPYIITILQGKTRPNRATWWIWVVITTILCISYTLTGAGITVWAFVCAGIGQLIIAILSVKYGEGGFSRFDQFCFLGAGISLGLWWLFNSPFLAIACNIVVDIMAVLPTIRKSYYVPEQEDLLSWFLYGIGSLLNLFTIQKISLNILALPVYVFCVNLIIVSLLLRPKLKHYLRSCSVRRHRLKRRKYIYPNVVNIKQP